MMRGKGNKLGKKMGEWELVGKLAENMATCWSELTNVEATVAGKLTAVTF